MENVQSLISFEYWILVYLISVITVAISTFIAYRSITRDVFLHHRISIVLTGIILCVTNAFIGSIIANALTKVPRIISATPSENSILPINNPTIDIVFTSPVSYRSLKVYSFPENELEILPEGYLNNRILFGRTVRIRPKHNFPPGERITVYIANIEGPLTHGYGGEQSIQYTNDNLPGVAKILSPAQYTNFPVRSSIQYQLTGSISKFGTWSVVSDPPALFDVIEEENTIKLTPQQDLKQGTVYTVQLIQSPEVISFSDGNTLFSLPSKVENTATFTTVKPPFINSFQPQDSDVHPNETIVIQFEEPMDKESVESRITIRPPVNIQPRWDMTKTTLMISHEAFQKDTNYQLQIQAGAKSAAGGTLDTMISYAIHSAGPLKLVSSVPGDLTVNATHSAVIRMNFNQPAHLASIKRTVKFTPEIKGVFTQEAKQIIFTPASPLNPSTKYTVSIPTGVESVYGLPSAARQSFTFTTRDDETSLAVPYFKQESNFTCNIASLRMLLAYRGIQTTETGLITKTGSGGKRGTGNPNMGYIDDYGTYWGAIYPVAQSYRTTTLLTNGTLQHIIDEIKSGNPVMIWGQNGWSDPHDISWTASDGTYIKAINGMHSAVVRGYTGPGDKPVSILLNDPWRGQYSIPTGEFVRRWNFFNVALVIK